MTVTNQQLYEKLDKLEERFNKILFGVNGSGGGIEGRLKSVEDFIADAKKVLWIIVGLVSAAVTVNIINIIVTHWSK